MKVKLLVSRAGVGFTQNCGDVIDVEDDEAKRLIDSNQAEPASARKGAGRKAVVEAAVKPTPKRRAKKKPVTDE